MESASYNEIPDIFESKIMQLQDSESNTKLQTALEVLYKLFNKYYKILFEKFINK